jgi:hypothetical protein
MPYFRALLLLLLTIGVLAGPALAADEEEPTANDLAEEFAKEFKKTYKKLPEGELFDQINKLVEFLKNEQVDDKRARKALLDGLSRVSAVREKNVVAHVMKQCAELGEEVVGIVVNTLLKEIKKERVPHEDVYENALDTLGKIRSENPKVVKTLTDLLKYKQDDVIARTAYALSFYVEASGRVRKEIFEELLKLFEGVYSSAQANPSGPMKNKWTIVGEDVMLALNKLSVPPRERADFPNPADARQWFNDHKKEPWEKRDE